MRSSWIRYFYKKNHSIQLTFLYALGVDRIRADTPQRVTKADSEDRVITQISAGYEHSVYISNPKGYVFTFGKGNLFLFIIEKVNLVNDFLFKRSIWLSRLW